MTEHPLFPKGGIAYSFPLIPGYLDNAYLASAEIYWEPLTEAEIKEAMLMSVSKNVGKPVPSGM